MKLRAILSTPDGDRPFTEEDVQRFMGADLLTPEEAARVVEIINADPDGTIEDHVRTWTIESYSHPAGTTGSAVHRH